MKKICISKNWAFTSPDYPAKQMVELPHDYVVTLPRDKNAPGGVNNGYATGTKGCYTKYLEFPPAAHTMLDIDGAYMCTRVLLNENQLAMHPNGYMPYLVDLTGHIREGKINKLDLDTKHLQPSCRWYSGGGVYRDVYLWTGGKVRIEPWDLFLSTKTLTETNARLSIEACIKADMACEAELQLAICDKDGRAVKKEVHILSLLQGENRETIAVNLDNPIPWDCENPYLYTLNVTLAVDGNLEDTTEQRFGIRTVSVDAKQGFLLNGKAIKLKGGCIHHDHGVLGAAEFPAAVERKLKKLKRVGYNAIRSSHNPPSLVMLETCDRLGILLMDEAFDEWNIPKCDLGYHLWFEDWWQRDISYMVLRDRSHPCVVSYSIGNEIPERSGYSDGAVWSKRLTEEVKKYDNTLPVTAGVCNLWYTSDRDAPEEYKSYYMRGLPDVGQAGKDTSWDKWTEDYCAPLDMVGYNYLYMRYEKDGNTYPNRVIWGSETHALSLFDSWDAVMKYDHVIGDFTWTAYDNLGEVGCGFSQWGENGFIPTITWDTYPSRTCYQGDFDLCGYRRPQSYFREAIWKNTTAPHIFTTHPKHNGDDFTGTGWHWYDVAETWTFGEEYLGEMVNCQVYTTADEVSFFLNDTLIGTAVPEKGIAALEIPYEPGEVRAVARRNGQVEAEASLKTTGKAYKLCVRSESETVVADNRDLCFYRISVTDKEGNPVIDEDYAIDCQVHGGELLGVFSGNPKSEDCFGTNRCHTFYGKALAVVRCKDVGEMMLKFYVHADGLKGGVGNVVTVQAPAQE